MKKKSLVLLFIFTISCNGNLDSLKSPQTIQPSESPNIIVLPSSAPTVTPVVSPAPKQEEPPKDIVDSNKQFSVLMETNMGKIKFKLFQKDAPKTVDNFVKLIGKKYYDGLTFHRVIDGFMIQGGDPLGTGFGGESAFGKAFEDEFSSNFKFDRKGLLAMANAGPNTNASQFFITLSPQPGLNNKHTIFGEVIEGMNVVEAIGKVDIDPRDKPYKSVIMTTVRIAE